MQDLYKLPKDILVKIIETGFSVDNLNKKECLDMKRKCEKRISKLRTEEMKEYLRNELSRYIITKEEIQEIKKHIDLITEVSLWKEENENENVGTEYYELIFYAKEAFEMSFLLQDGMYWISNNKYISVYDKERKEMINEYYKYADEKVTGIEKLSPLTIFHSFILDTVNVECINKIFEKNFHSP